MSACGRVLQRELAYDLLPLLGEVLPVPVG
jgi:hypothetical protein